MKQTLKKILIVFICLIIPVNIARADLLDQINSEISKKRQLSKDLEKKAKDYNNQITQKKKEAENLANQIEIVETEIEETATNIQLAKNQIEILEIEIKRISGEITVKEAEIAENKNYLTESLRKIYEYDNTEMIAIILTESTFSGFLDKIEYVKSLQSNLKSAIESLKNKRKELEENKEQLEVKKFEMLGLKEQQEYQKSILDKQKDSKNNLLAATKGKEKEYQELLQKINKERSEILGDLEELEKQKSEELAKARKRQADPVTGKASTSWYFRQNDPRWKDTTIGHSRSTMGRYGCAVTSVAMVAKFLGTNITPGELAKMPYYYKDLIKWPQELGNMELVLNLSKAGADWNRIDEELRKGYPVIVFIRRTNGTGGHYVVIAGKDATNGKYVVHDPYFGPNIYLDSSRENISILYGGCGTKIDQMVIYHKK